MANHTSRGSVSGAAVAGDTYTVVIPYSGTYELAVSATLFGSTGVVCKRVMPNGTSLVTLAALTENGSTVLNLTQGTVRLYIDASATVVQVVFGQASR
jgi:hypothetical protein